MGIGAVRRAEDREKILKQLVQTPLSTNVFGRTIGRCLSAAREGRTNRRITLSNGIGVPRSIGVLETKQG
jgi:hypothetical protein